MASNSNSSSGGIGVFGILGCIFITLKLCKVIDWEWWWVLAPFWGPLALAFAILLIFIIIYMLIVVCKYMMKQYRKHKNKDKNHG